MTDCTDECDLAELCTQRHWSIYWLIIAASVLFAAGRILTVGIDSGSGETTPMLSANDRSRWATVRSLVDLGTYEIDDVITDNSIGINWDSIDKVQHLGVDDQPHFYSSKPTLLPTLVAAVYFVVKSATDLELATNPMATVKIILLLVNAIPWLLFLCLLAATLEKIQVRDWTRYFIVAAAGFATFLSTFVVSLNNHIPAAVCVMASLNCLVWIVKFNDQRWKTFAIAGLVSAFAVANELPALSFFAIAATVCLLKSPAKFLTGFLPAAALVIGGFFYTNVLAHDDWRPPYAHKQDGELIERFSDADFSIELDEQKIPTPIRATIEPFELMAPTVERANWPFQNDKTIDRWVIRDIRSNRFTIISSDSNEYELRQWDNWYDYEGSYWTGKTKSDVDLGQPDSILYLFHVIFGHHGILSLTPIWLLSLAGLIALVFSNKLQLRWLGIISLLLTAVVIGFYVFYIPAHDRNYGGFTSAFRWAFWLAPIWLLGMAPVVDWMGRTKQGRAVCIILLLLSGFSALYSADNPWTQPWLYQIWDVTGLPK